MEFDRGFKARANRIAVKVRTDLGLLPSDPLDPWVLCRHFEIDVIVLSELLDADGMQVGSYFLQHEKGTFSAITVPCGLRRAIVHNDSHAEVRQRSNLMHEIAHSFLGHKATPLLTGDGERHFDQTIEAEAQYLAGCLLITNEGAYYIARKKLSPFAEQMYGVSNPMLNYRLRVSGALRRLSRYSRLVNAV